ncbi:MAG TPA: hypothetical protein VHC22_12305 [Pirellulales bacterium]|nr:hypothetical protein [Pirellulales bacterium]
MERKPNRVGKVILAAIVGLLIAYPLSVGPVAFAAQLIDWQAPDCKAGDLVAGFYLPLWKLPDPMHDWTVGWWNCGCRLAGWLAMRMPILGP